MKPFANYLFVAGLLSFASVACSHLNSTVSETKDGSKITLMRAFTLFDSKSDLAKFKAGQTDKSQSIGIGGLNQESSGSNVVRSLELINAILSKGAMLP